MTVRLSDCPVSRFYFSLAGAIIDSAEVIMRSVFIAAVILGLGLPAAGAADPDQVLVLYNSDYGIDQYDSDLGQDSKEVAEHYVRRHTDPRTGKRPYILGLHCIHGKDHLNTFRVPESSKDNYFGLEYTGDETVPKDWPVADSRHVQAVPAFPIEPVDPTAAGDAFTAALALECVRGTGLVPAARVANAAGALACLKRGAQPSMPSAREVEAFLHRHA